MHIPHGPERQGFELFAQGQAGETVVRPLGLPQRFDRQKQGEKESLERGAGADDPGSDPVEAGVEIIQGEMRPVQGPAADDFLGDGEKVVVQDDDMVAVPAEAAAQMEDEAGGEQQDRRDLVGHGFRRMEMAEVEADAFSGSEERSAR